MQEIYFINCVDSIQKTNYENYEIIVVDNDSNDGSHIECSKKFPKISLIENIRKFGLL